VEKMASEQKPSVRNLRSALAVLAMFNGHNKLELEGKASKQTKT
jgi:hypothetical protein